MIFGARKKKMCDHKPKNMLYTALNIILCVYVCVCEKSECGRTRTRYPRQMFQTLLENISETRHSLLSKTPMEFTLIAWNLEPLDVCVILSICVYKTLSVISETQRYMLYYNIAKVVAAYNAAIVF